MFTQSKHIIPILKYNCHLRWVSPHDYHNYDDLHHCYGTFVVDGDFVELINNSIFSLPINVREKENIQKCSVMNIFMDCYKKENNKCTFVANTDIKTIKFIMKDGLDMVICYYPVNGLHEFILLV